MQRAGVERALHQQDAHRAGGHQAVRGPALQHPGDPVVLQDLQRLPGQRVLDAEHQAGPEAGQGGPPFARSAPASLHRGERDEGDATGGRPVREGSERLPDRLDDPGQRQDRLTGDEHQRADDLDDAHRLMGHRDGQDEGNEQVERQQRLDQAQRKVAEGPRREDLAPDHAADPGQPSPLLEQVEEQPRAEKVGLRRGLGGLLLQNEADAQQHGCYQRDRVVHGANLPARRENTCTSRDRFDAGPYFAGHGR